MEKFIAKKCMVRGCLKYGVLQLWLTKDRASHCFCDDHFDSAKSIYADYGIKINTLNLEYSKKACKIEFEMIEKLRSLSNSETEPATDPPPNPSPGR
jgi:hypothetical protein